MFRSVTKLFKSTEHPKPEKHRAHIVIADDDATDLRMIEYCIRREFKNIDIVKLKEYGEFLDYFADLRSKRIPAPSIAFIDAKMKGMSGLDFIRMLKMTVPKCEACLQSDHINRYKMEKDIISKTHKVDYVLPKETNFTGLLKRLHEHLNALHA